MVLAYRKAASSTSFVAVPVSSSLKAQDLCNLIGWKKSDLQTRKDTRESAWQLDGWADTVHKVTFFSCFTTERAEPYSVKTAQLATSMDALILAPLQYSPLK